MPRTGPPDPLGITANPRCYVPLASTERAISALRAGVCARRSPLILRGPAGAGKTLVLRVLAERGAAEGHRVVFSPFLHFSPAELTPWLFHLLGAPCPGAATREPQLVEALRGGAARPTLLLVDEAQSAPAATLLRLGKLAEAAGPRLLLVAAVRSTQWAPELGRAEVISLPASLPAPEMHRLCDGLLAQRGAPAALAALPAREREALVDPARGVPALLIVELLRRGSRDSGPREPAVETRARAASSEEGARASPALVVERAVPVARLSRGAARWRGRALAAPTRAHWRGRLVSALALCQVQRGASVAVSALRTRGLLATDRGRQLAVATLWRGGRALAQLLARAIDWGEAWDPLDGPMWRQLDRAVRTVSPRSVSWPLHPRETTLRWGRQARLRADALRARAWVDAVRGPTWIRARSAAVAARAVSELPRLSARLAWASRIRVRARLCGSGALVLSASAVAGIAMVALYGGAVPGTSAHFPTRAIPEISPPPRAPTPASPSTSVAPTLRMRVRVNARPWAWIRVDGVEVGATPLSHLRLERGPHEFEALFADGRRSLQTVVIAAEDSAVSLR